MVFSHGLGGSRNAYSHITGSLASHGMVVVAAEHRDGSAPISYIHSPDSPHPRAIDYRSLPHQPSPEVGKTRKEQLRIRLWELGLIHDALMKMDNDLGFPNIAPDRNMNVADEHAFASFLDVHTPGKIAWTGHSFGASTIVQFVKSIYYHPPLHLKEYQPLYAPSADSAISRQITPRSPITLLDLWALPIQFSDNWLLEKPLPAYDSTDGSSPLAVLSEAFFKWKSNLNETKTAISPPKGQQRSKIKPRIFYPIASAHLSQSDFGPLFPWLTKKVFKAEDSDRTLRLNVRAILESLRRSGIQVADTSAADMELNTLDTPSGAKQVEVRQKFPLSQDYSILATDGSIKGWVPISLYEQNGSAEMNGHAIEAGNPGEAVMEGEMMKE